MTYKIPLEDTSDPRKKGYFKEKREERLQEMMKMYKEVLTNTQEEPFFSESWIKKNILKR